MFVAAAPRYFHSHHFPPARVKLHNWRETRRYTGSRVKSSVKRWKPARTFATAFDYVSLVSLSKQVIFTATGDVSPTTKEHRERERENSFDRSVCPSRFSHAALLNYFWNRFPFDNFWDFCLAISKWRTNSPLSLSLSLSPLWQCNEITPRILSKSLALNFLHLFPFS